jgi:SET domain-containing protein
LIEYIGEIIDQGECIKRQNEYKRLNLKIYIMKYENKLFIDATIKGNNSRYLNHSCNPNCEVQKVGYVIKILFLIFDNI